MGNDYFETVKEALKDAMGEINQMERYTCIADYETVGIMTIHNVPRAIECSYKKGKVYDVLKRYGDVYEASTQIFIVNKMGRKCQVFNEKNSAEFRKYFKRKCRKAKLDIEPILESICVAGERAEYFEDAYVRIEDEINHEKNNENNPLVIKELLRKQKIVEFYKSPTTRIY